SWRAARSTRVAAGSLGWSASRYRSELRARGRREVGERPRHEPRLTRRHERPTAVEAEGGTGRVRRKRTQARTAEVAVVAREFVALAQHPPARRSRSRAKAGSYERLRRRQGLSLMKTNHFPADSICRNRPLITPSEAALPMHA